MTTSLILSTPDLNQHLLTQSRTDSAPTLPPSPKQTTQLKLSPTEYCKIVIKRLAFNCSTLQLFCCCLPVTASLAFAGAYCITQFYLPLSIQNNQAAGAAIVAAFALTGIVLAPLCCTALLPKLCQYCCGIFVATHKSSQPTDIIIDVVQSPIASP